MSKRKWKFFIASTAVVAGVVTAICQIQSTRTERAKLLDTGRIRSEASHKFVAIDKTSMRRRSTHTITLSNGITIEGLRKFPYPYKAMLAISSDADHETLRKFNLIHEFINTTDETPMGKGVGLDFADSFFMYNGSDSPTPVDYGKLPIDKEFTYFKGVSNQIYGGNIINQYIHDGWIDTMHSYGDFTQVNPHNTLFNRSLAVQAISQLKSAGDDITVWTDHGNKANVDNFGSHGHGRFFNYQQGSTPNSSYYHTDLTIPFGIKFVWPDLPDQTVGYPNIIFPITLQDGQKVWGFHRFTGEFNQNGDPIWLWTADDFDRQVNWLNIKSLIWNREYAIIAQHLSSNNTENPLPQNTIDALRFLAGQQKDGNVLVARTSRLLDYNVAQEYLQYTVAEDGTKATIHITSIDDPVFGSHIPTIDELRGITFYTSNPDQTQIDIGNTPIPRSLIQYNPTDDVSPSIGVKWFPQDTKNYAISDASIA